MLYTQVLRKVPHVGEHASAVLARHWAWPTVHCFLMPLGVACIPEPLAAHATRVWPLSRVGHDVSLQFILLWEKAAAVGAHIRLRVTSVEFAMACHYRRVAEGLAALGALVGLFFRVRPQVDVEAAALVEALLAKLAGEGALACVSPLVPRDAPPFIARVGAIGASILSPRPLGVFPCPVPV